MTEKRPDFIPVNEPDFVEYKNRNGYHYILCRNAHYAWCGYLILENTHPLYGIDEFECKYASTENIVHGGITYNDHFPKKFRHLTEEELNDKWIIGFDCSHCDDLDNLSCDYTFELKGNKTYRTFEWVLSELDRLVHNIANAFPYLDLDALTLREIKGLKKRLPNENQKALIDKELQDIIKP